MGLELSILIVFIILVVYKERFVMSIQKICFNFISERYVPVDMNSKGSTFLAVN